MTNDHTDTNPYGVSDGPDGPWSRPAYLDKIIDDATKTYGGPIDVVSDVPGYGRHTHGDACDPRPFASGGCGRHFDDSDRIVTVTYGERGYQSVYGVLDGKITVWMD